MKLLIAEDNAAMRQLICSIVADLADGIVECSNGAEAVAAYGEHHPDWVLMDLRMDVMDGLQATRAIKAQWPDARVVIVTSYNDAKLRVEASRAGACRYVLKEELLSLRQLITNNTE